MYGKGLGRLANSVSLSSRTPLRPPGSREGVIFACSLNLNLNQTVRATPLLNLAPPSFKKGKGRSGRVIKIKKKESVVKGERGRR